MKILFFGDSITDACRNRDDDAMMPALGCGYVALVAGRLFERDPMGYEIINRGIGGDRAVDLYGRIRRDVWEAKPDVLSIYVGVNDVWHEIGGKNGFDVARYEKVYRAMLYETLERLPDVKIILVAPFVLKGRATAEKFDRFKEVFKYADVVERLAAEYGLPFVPLQETFDNAAEKYGATALAYDGVHPTVLGATLLAGEWLKAFDKM